MARYTNVADIFRDPGMDPEVREEVLKTLESRQAVSQLTAMRMRAGLSQSQVAKQMECSQGKISKFEHSKDDDLTLGKIKAYAEAVQCDFATTVTPKDIEPVDHVKLHAFAIHRHMKDMAKLAHRDEDVAKKVAEFFGEVFFNMSRLINDASEELPHMDFTLTEDAQEHDVESGIPLHS